jgi:hypothetical protein
VRLCGHICPKGRGHGYRCPNGIEVGEERWAAVWRLGSSV